MLNQLSPAAVIFDFDGVIADSEVLTNTVLAEAVTRLGLPTTLDDALNRYQGRRWTEVANLIEKGTGRPLAGSFADKLKCDTLQRLRTDLDEVEGATAFIRTLSLPKCIASSSSMQRLTVSLERLSLLKDFDGMYFSADVVRRGKPAPDIFLHAAERMNVSASDCVVIEDSPSGVQAGVAAGMTVIGLVAAGHCRDGHAETLHEAGACRVVDSWSDVATLIDMPR